MSSKWRILIAVAVFLPVLGCGGGGSSAAPPAPAPAAVTISVKPASADLGPSQTQQFTASVANSTNTAVTWKINGTTGGGGTAGTISPSGLYTAPPTTPSPNTATITAVAKADTSKKATAGILIVPNRGQQAGTLALGPSGAAPPDSTPQSPAVGMTLAKSGRTTGLTCGPIQSINTTVSVDYQQGCGSGTSFKVTFNNQIMVNSVAFSDSGDSGSLMVNST